jgi:hypothetical protein
MGEAPREQALIVEQPSGVVVLTGCAHPVGGGDCAGSPGRSRATAPGSGPGCPRRRQPGNSGRGPLPQGRWRTGRRRAPGDGSPEHRPSGRTSRSPAGRGCRPDLRMNARVE